MSTEYYIKANDQSWYKQSKDRIRDKLRGLTSFVKEESLGEYWLKDPNSESSWEFDVRVFVDESGILIEVSVHNDVFFVDLRHFYEGLSAEGDVDLVDDDGEKYRFE